MRKAEEVERRWFALTLLRPVRHCESSELNEPSFLRMQFKPELCQTRTQLLPA